MTNEEAFHLGAEAMRTEIAARLMIKHAPAGLIVAPAVLAMPVPRFQVPEQQVVYGNPEVD